VFSPTTSFWFSRNFRQWFSHTHRVFFPFRIIEYFLFFKDFRLFYGFFLYYGSYRLKNNTPRCHWLLRSQFSRFLLRQSPLRIFSKLFMRPPRSSMWPLAVPSPPPGHVRSSHYYHSSFHESFLFPHSIPVYFSKGTHFFRRLFSPLQGFPPVIPFGWRFKPLEPSGVSECLTPSCFLVVCVKSFRLHPFLLIFSTETRTPSGPERFSFPPRFAWVTQACFFCGFVCFSFCFFFFHGTFFCLHGCYLLAFFPLAHCPCPPFPVFHHPLQLGFHAADPFFLLQILFHSQFSPVPSRGRHRPSFSHDP